MREELGDLCNNSTAYERHDDFAPFNRNKPRNGLEKVFYKCICANLTSALCTGILYTLMDDSATSAVQNKDLFVLFVLIHVCLALAGKLLSGK